MLHCFLRTQAPLVLWQICVIIYSDKVPPNKNTVQLPNQLCGCMTNPRSIGEEALLFTGPMTIRPCFTEFRKQVQPLSAPHFIFISDDIHSAIAWLGPLLGSLVELFLIPKSAAIIALRSFCFSHSFACVKTGIIYGMTVSDHRGLETDPGSLAIRQL